MYIHNIDSIPNEFISKFFVGAETHYLGKAAGSQRIYVNIDKVPPGECSTKYHSHSIQEEFFIILNGAATLRMGGKEYPVTKGDFISKQPGEENAHLFYNSGKQILEILDVGTVEEGDICFYPDEEIYYLRDKKMAFNKKDLQSDWSSESGK